MMRTSNPTLTASTFTQPAIVGEQRMTIQGTVNKTALLLTVTMVSAICVWNVFMKSPASAMPFVFGGAIGGLIAALVTCWKKQWSAVTGTIYALCEGLFIGGISAMYERQFHGIVLQAGMLTFGTLFALL